MRKMSYHKLKNIAITQENYDRLRRLGNAGDSFNDVMTELLNRNQKEIDFRTLNECAEVTNTELDANIHGLSRDMKP